MNAFIYIILFAMVIMMSLKNFKMMGRYKHNKDYIAAYQGLLKGEDGNYQAICDYIGKEEAAEFQNKGRILKLFYDLDYGTAEETLEKLDLHDFYFKKDRFDPENANMNADSALWMMLDMAKAARLGNFAFNDRLMEIYDRNKDVLENYLEYHLLHSCHDIVNKKEGRDTKFLTDLLKGEYEYRYDKQMIGLYKRFAEALLAYEDDGLLGEYEVEDLPRFAGSLIGAGFMKELGIYDTWAPKEDREEETAEDTAEEVTEEAEETAEEAVEDKTEEIIVEAPVTAAEEVKEETEEETVSEEERKEEKTEE
ncbi:MAG: hypothetical protein IIZ33_05665 [Erysipelotrichaceae bacterium]|nr:hypothetical protein [Erysipelotrichaceae bacterium]